MVLSFSWLFKRNTRAPERASPMSGIRHVPADGLRPGYSISARKGPQQLLALLGRREMSDLSPQSGPKRTLDWVAVNRDFMTTHPYKRATLPGLPWSPEFMAAYEKALAGAPALIGANRHDPGTVEAVVTAYVNSKSFGGFAAATQRMRRALLKRFCAEHGDKRLAMMEPRHVAKLLELLEPHPQRNMLKALRGLMTFAVAGRVIDADPTVGYKLKRARDTGGFKTWTEADIAQFEHRHPLGSKPRLAL